MRKYTNILPYTRSKTTKKGRCALCFPPRWNHALQERPKQFVWTHETRINASNITYWAHSSTVEITREGKTGAKTVAGDTKTVKVANQREKKDKDQTV